MEKLETLIKYVTDENDWLREIIHNYKSEKVKTVKKTRIPISFRLVFIPC